MTGRSRPAREISSDYSARTAYQDYSAGENYEGFRFSGPAGRYRRRAERRAVDVALAQVPNGVEILDCPCGTGRWWPVLSEKARRIVAVDISKGMLRHAGERVRSDGVEVALLEADAESLPLPDESIDWVFSFALTKHLPHPVQYRVLAEFGRVAKAGVICTFGVFTHLSYEIWRRRRLAGSFPLLAEQLDQMAAEAGLRVGMSRRCTTPIGTERVVLFEKHREAG